METTVKNNVIVLKSEIKKLAEEQKILKNQRKTEHLVGERTMEPWVAACKHRANRDKLRIMYAAYGLMRGKSFSQIENKHSEEDHPLKNFLPQISKMIEIYNKMEDKKDGI